MLIEIQRKINCYRRGFITLWIADHKNWVFGCAFDRVCEIEF